MSATLRVHSVVAGLAINLLVAGIGLRGRSCLEVAVLSSDRFGQLQLQAVAADVPQQLLVALPCILTIAVLVGSRGRANAPLAVSRPYARE